MSTEPLATAIYEGNTPLVHEILTTGFREDGFSHYDFAEQTRMYDTMMTIAVKYGNMEIIKELINKGYSLNDGDDFKKTPLICAVELRKYDVLELLLASGASINTPAYWNDTPLYNAAAIGDEKSVNILLQAGADTSILARDFSGGTKTAYDIAISNNHINVAQLIKQHR